MIENLFLLGPNVTEDELHNMEDLCMKIILDLDEEINILKTDITPIQRKTIQACITQNVN